MSNKLLKSLVEGNIADFRTEFKNKLNMELGQKLLLIQKNLFKESQKDKR